MRGTLAIVAGFAAAVLVAVPAGAVSSTDIYVTGSVLKRVVGKNTSTVRLAWDYKCLGEDGGTYEWTLKVVRTQPEPERTTTLGSGNGERGSKTVRLPPGHYLSKADPFFCETERGQGFEQPEIGGTFVVPDYCAWTVTSVRGLVQHQRGTVVRAAKAGASIAQSDQLTVPQSGKAVLRAPGRDGTATLAGGSEVRVDPRHCPGKLGWKLIVDKGSLTAAVPKGAAAKGSFVVATGNATVSGGPGARWIVDYANRKTKVRAIAGVVRVPGKTLRAGQTTTI
jgi:hypothetical protein